MRKLFLLSILLAGLHAPIPCQTAPTANPQAVPFAFDAVVIKPNNSGENGTDIDFDDTTFQAKNMLFRNLVAEAYGIRADLISGIPAWAESARFDVNAKVVDPDVKALEALTRQQRRAMVAAFVVDRFKLKVHFEPKMLPVFDLVLLKDGPKFKQSPLIPSASGAPDFGPPNMSTNNNDMTATAVPMSQLAEALTRRSDRPVVDKTGLTSKYDFHLIWSSDRAFQAAEDSGKTDIPPVLFTALQEQLGLKLVPGKGSVPTLVVDHAEPPSEN